MKVRSFRVIIAGAALLAAFFGSASVSCSADTLPTTGTQMIRPVLFPAGIQITPIVKLGSAIQEEYDHWTPANRTQVLLDSSTAKSNPSPTAVILKKPSQANIL